MSFIAERSGERADVFRSHDCARAVRADSAGNPESGVVEIEFASGARMRIAGALDPSMASAMIATLTVTKRRRRR